jgi:hypothetical protein
VDVAITGVTETMTASAGRALKVKIDFQTVKRAIRETIQVPLSRLRRPRRGSGKKLTGAKAQTDAEAGRENWQRWNDFQRGIKRRTDKARQDIPRYRIAAPTGTSS